MASGGEFDRRSLLVGAGIAGGGLALGIAIPFASERVRPAAGTFQRAAAAVTSIARAAAPARRK